MPTNLVVVEGLEDPQVSSWLLYLKAWLAACAWMLFSSPISRLDDSSKVRSPSGDVALRNPSTELEELRREGRQHGREPVEG